MILIIYIDVILFRLNEDTIKIYGKFCLLVLNTFLCENAALAQHVGKKACQLR